MDSYFVIRIWCTMKIYLKMFFPKKSYSIKLTVTCMYIVLF